MSSRGGCASIDNALTASQKNHLMQKTRRTDTIYSWRAASCGPIAPNQQRHATTPERADIPRLPLYAKIGILQLLKTICR